MRIAFLTHWRGGRQTGPFRKITAQVAEWTAAGHTVGVFAATSSEWADDWTRLPVAHHVLSCRSGLRKAGERQRLAATAQSWNPDVVYERHGLYYPAHSGLGRHVPIVTEINGNDLGEWKLKSRSKALYNRATRSRGLRDAAGYVFVTHQLKDASSFAQFARRRPSLVLGNGIDLESVPWTPPPTNVDRNPRLVFVGHPHTPWHGIDHLVELARLRPNLHVDVVGLDREELFDAPGNVVCHGELMPTEYAQLIAAADIGVGTLGLYRKNMDEACALKVREYLAAGLPVILGCSDTDFLDGRDFLLQVPNRWDGLVTALPEVDAFVARWLGKRVPRSKVRHLDASFKEGRRLEFLARVVNQYARR